MALTAALVFLGGHFLTSSGDMSEGSIEARNKNIVRICLRFVGLAK